jgi:hypothetical protein
MHDFPQLDVAEVGEELERSQQREALGSSTPWNWPRGTCWVVTSAEIACGELAPVAGAIARLLGERLLDHVVERGGDSGADVDQRRRLDVVDLMHHGRLHLHRRAAGRR